MTSMPCVVRASRPLVPGTPTPAAPSAASAQAWRKAGFHGEPESSSYAAHAAHRADRALAPSGQSRETLFHHDKPGESAVYATSVHELSYTDPVHRGWGPEDKAHTQVWGASSAWNSRVQVSAMQPRTETLAQRTAAWAQSKPRTGPDYAGVEPTTASALFNTTAGDDAAATVAAMREATPAGLATGTATAADRGSLGRRAAFPQPVGASLVLRRG